MNHKVHKHLCGRFRLTFYLGGLYDINGVVCRFIKVTEKGFNFLNEQTDKCVLKNHLYSRKHRGIPLPNNITQVHTYVPQWLRPNYLGPMRHKDGRVCKCG